MKFQTPFNRSNSILGENYKNIKSITQPEQVLPLKRILDGLKNGSIILDAKPVVYDIPEHEIDVVPGSTAVQTNANIAAATSADLAESADKAGEDITARPSFTIEDAQPTIDAVESAIIANAEGESGQAARPNTQAAGEPNPETFASNTDSTPGADGAAQ